MSLRDQLLKAGLVSQEAVKKLESDKRRKNHQGKKDKRIGKAEAAQKAAQQQQLEQAARQKREQDRKLNQVQNTERQRKANRATILDLLGKHRTNEKNANQVYNFQDGRYIRRVNVTDQQLFLITYGQVGIVRNPKDVFDYPIVPREIALKIAQLDERSVVVLHNENEGPAEEPDPLSG